MHVGETCHMTRFPRHIKRQTEKQWNTLAMTRIWWTVWFDSQLERQTKCCAWNVKCHSVEVCLLGDVGQVTLKFNQSINEHRFFSNSWVIVSFFPCLFCRRFDFQSTHWHSQFCPIFFVDHCDSSTKCNTLSCLALVLVFNISAVLK